VILVVVVVVDIDGGVGVVPRRRRRAVQGGSTLFRRWFSGSTRAEGASRILSSDSPRRNCAFLPPSRRGARERTCRDDEASDTFGRGDRGDPRVVRVCACFVYWRHGTRAVEYRHQASGPVKAGGIHEGPAGFELHVSPHSISSQVPCECEREKREGSWEGSSEFVASEKLPAVQSSTAILTLRSVLRGLLIAFAGKTRKTFSVFFRLKNGNPDDEWSCWIIIWDYYRDILSVTVNVVPTRSRRDPKRSFEIPWCCVTDLPSFPF
jgi:hypothetical protein